MESRFDTLAKLLASGMSRREALRRLSGTTAGVVLAALGIGCRDDVVGPLRPTGLSTGPLLAKGGNAGCADFCNNLPPGPARGECASQAAKGVGLCIECGGDFARICATGPGTFICCDTAGGQVCCPGAGRCCPVGSLCDPMRGCVCPTGTRECGAMCCTDTLACCGGVCCDAGQICRNNVCGVGCPAGQTPCGTTNCCAPPRICNPATGVCVCPPGTDPCAGDCCDPRQGQVCGQPLTDRCIQPFYTCGINPLCPNEPIRHACCEIPVIGGRRCCATPLAFCSGTSPSGCCLLEDPIFGVCVTPVP